MVVIVETVTGRIVGQVLAKNEDGSFNILRFNGNGGEKVEGFTLGMAYQVETI